jgi:hypothetical protein
MESKTKGTMILRYRSCFLKVIKVRSSGDNDWTFECRDLNTNKQDQTLRLNQSGFLEALDKALPAMKNPKDVFFLDLDNNGKWSVTKESEIDKLIR